MKIKLNLSTVLMLAMIAIIGLSITACSDKDKNSEATKYAAKGRPTAGDVYVDATIGEASNLIPWIASDASSHAISSMIYNGLLKYDKNLNLVGDLAESWKVSNDGLTITFKIRKNVKWADGKELTARDVMASFKTITNPKTITPYAGDYQMVKKAMVIGSHTFRVTYNEVFAPALSSWTLAVLPKHLLKKQDINNSDLKTQPMGTGSYKLEKWLRGKEISLLSNPNHYEHQAWVDKVRMRLIPDMDTQFLELKAQRLDTMTLKPLQFTRLTDKKKFTNKFSKYKWLGNNYTYMGFKLSHPIFKDKLVRQALSYATPRTDMIKGSLMGQGLAINAPFKPGTWAYNEKLVGYEYNIKKAKQLLSQAGWEDSDKDGLLDKKLTGINSKQDGNTPFEFTVVTNQGNDQRIKAAEIMQQSFAKLGVKMNIRVQEWSTFIENTIHGKKFEAFILGWSLTPEPDPYDIWHSSKTGKREFNIVGFNNKEADKMMVKARGTFDKSLRKKYLDRFQEIIHDEQPYLFLFAPYTLVATHKRFKGIEESPAGIGHNFIDWYVPKNQQMYNNEVITP